tara:strand:+ start:5056 stop:5532 length:477 start_codon:yes stop_codon:yes gene_type:complete
MDYNITADSIPDFDGWGPDDYWSALDWINWHKARVIAYGVDSANEKIISEFGGIGHYSLSVSRESYYISQDDMFRNYFDGFYIQGISIKEILISMYFGGEFVEITNSTGDSIYEGIGDLAKTAIGTVKAVPYILILAVIAALYIIYKNEGKIPKFSIT